MLVNHSCHKLRAHKQPNSTVANFPMALIFGSSSANAHQFCKCSANVHKFHIMLSKHLVQKLTSNVPFKAKSKFSRNSFNVKLYNHDIPKFTRSPPTTCKMLECAQQNRVWVYQEIATNPVITLKSITKSM